VSGREEGAGRHDCSTSDTSEEGEDREATRGEGERGRTGHCCRASTRWSVRTSTHSHTKASAFFSLSVWSLRIHGYANPFRQIHASILWFRNGTPILSDTRSSQPSRWDINMDASAWFRDNRGSDYVPSTYHRFLSYKRGLEEQGTPWNGFTHNKFLCYFIYFGTNPQDQITMEDPRTKRSIPLPRGPSRYSFT
jgi:hypothetical protein